MSILNKGTKAAPTTAPATPPADAPADAPAPDQQDLQDTNATEEVPTNEVDYDKEVTVTVGDLLDMHRMLGYCMRGNQRPLVLRVQAICIGLLPEGTPIIHREPTE